MYMCTRMHEYFSQKENACTHAHVTSRRGIRGTVRAPRNYHQPVNVYVLQYISSRFRVQDSITYTSCTGQAQPASWPIGLLQRPGERSSTLQR